MYLITNILTIFYEIPICQHWSLVLVLLIMTSNPIGNLSTVEAAFAQVRPDNTYLPYNGF